MRLLIGLACLLTVYSTYCQETHPVTVSVAVVPTGPKQYNLVARISLRPGFHLYAANNADKGLEAVHFALDYPSLETGAPAINRQPVTMKDPIFENQPLPVYTDDLTLTQSIRFRDAIPDNLPVTIKAFAASRQEFQPVDETVTVMIPGGTKTGEAPTGISSAKPRSDCGDQQAASQKSRGLAALFLIGLGGGLLALLTPCIFPMIPMTVSFFTSRATTKRKGIQNALAYAGYIILIYTAVSVPFHLAGNINPQLFNNISTNPGLNIFFFILFVAFSLSFFGLFEIKLPPAIANSAASRTGIFFMALTLVIVSFSCTGIILGSLLVNALSASGNAWQLTAGMAGFGAGLALPFGTFALFPNWLKVLPKSGGWLDTFKKTLAFIELALAIKFLSNADLVMHWGILKREVFIGCWVVISLACGLFLLDAFPKRKDQEDTPPGNVRIFAGLGFLLFAALIVQGTFISGFTPPASYSIYKRPVIKGKGLVPDVINDYSLALDIAKRQGKPLLIDFTGWACVNCRKMEELVWTEPSVSQLIHDKFVLVSLYVDDREKLPGGKTKGEIWAAFQAAHFKQVTQPLYVLLGNDGQLLNNPVGYTPKADQYKQWLECGLAAIPPKPTTE